MWFMTVFHLFGFGYNLTARPFPRSSEDTLTDNEIADTHSRSRSIRPQASR